MPLGTLLKAARSCPPHEVLDQNPYLSSVLDKRCPEKPPALLPACA